LEGFQADDWHSRNAVVPVRVLARKNRARMAMKLTHKQFVFTRATVQLSKVLLAMLISRIVTIFIPAHAVATDGIDRPLRCDSR
jgi:hypothetical protein